MNNIFSFKRFLMLFGKHTIENYKIYLLATGVLTGILAMFMGFAAYMDSGRFDIDSQFGFFLSFFLLGGTIFTSIIFSDLGDRKKSISQLVLPVSHFERYLVAWIYSFIVFQVVFCICYYAVDSVVISFPISTHDPKNALLNVFTDERYNSIFLAFIALHSVTFLGAIFFEKYHFIRTAFVFFVGILILILVNKLMLGFLISDQLRNNIPFSGLEVRYTENDNWSYRHIGVSDGFANISIYTTAVVVLLMWACAYFKLKEKEV